MRGHSSKGKGWLIPFEGAVFETTAGDFRSETLNRVITILITSKLSIGNMKTHDKWIAAIGMVIFIGSMSCAIWLNKSARYELLSCILRISLS